MTLIPDNAVCVRTEINEENEETTKFDKVHTQNIKTDDIILIKKNERIAADGIVIKGKCHLNEQVFTGKSEVRNISKGDKVLAGTLVEDGEIYVQVSAFGEDSFLYNIISLIEEGENSKPNLSRLADKVSSIAIQIILAFGLLCGIIWYFIDYDFLFSLNVFISILIIGAPGSLGLAIPLSVLVASRKGKSQGILIRRISSFEIIKNSTAFVFNQTGTITKGTPEITDIIILGDMKKEELLFYAASTEMNSLHPLARSIVTEAIKNNITLVTPDPFKIISGEGIEAIINETRVDIGNYK